MAVKRLSPCQPEPGGHTEGPLGGCGGIWACRTKDRKAEVNRSEQGKAEGLQVQRLPVTPVCLSLATEKPRIWAEEHSLDKVLAKGPRFYAQC